MTVLIYVDTSKQVGDRDHLKVFANRKPRKPGSRKTTPKAWPSSTTFWNERGRQLRRPYFKINHKAAPAVAVTAIDITMDSANSFAHSQYDTHAISGRLHCRAASVPGKYWQAPVQFVPK